MQWLCCRIARPQAQRVWRRSSPRTAHAPRPRLPLHSVDPTPPFDVTAPGYSLSNNVLSVCMDCCCILSVPSWASYKYIFGLVWPNSSLLARIWRKLAVHMHSCQPYCWQYSRGGLVQASRFHVLQRSNRKLCVHFFFSFYNIYAVAKVTQIALNSANLVCNQNLLYTNISEL